MAIAVDLIVESGLSLSHSVATDAHLLSSMGKQGSGRRPVLRIYTLERPSLLLGRFQPVSETFSLENLQPDTREWVGRRLTGGRAVPAGPGFIGISLVLPMAWDLAGDPQRILSPELVLNRYVRGVLRGCNRLNVKAVYLGRDVITVNRKKIALVGFTCSEEGGVLFECHLALSGDLSFLDSSLASISQLKGPQIRLPDPPVTSVETEADRSISAAQMAEALSKGSESRLGLLCHERSWNAEEKEEIERVRTTLVQSGSWIEERKPRPLEVLRSETESQLGRFSVAVALGKDGRIASVTLGGDILSDDRTIAELETAFRGQPCEWTALGKITDQVLSRPKRFILGLGSRSAIPDILMEAVQ